MFKFNKIKQAIFEGFFQQIVTIPQKPEEGAHMWDSYNTGQTLTYTDSQAISEGDLCRFYFAYASLPWPLPITPRSYYMYNGQYAGKGVNPPYGFVEFSINERQESRVTIKDDATVRIVDHVRRLHLKGDIVDPYCTHGLDGRDPIKTYTGVCTTRDITFESNTVAHTPVWYYDGKYIHIRVLSPYATPLKHWLTPDQLLTGSDVELFTINPIFYAHHASIRGKSPKDYAAEVATQGYTASFKSDRIPTQVTLDLMATEVYLKGHAAPNVVLSTLKPMGTTIWAQAGSGMYISKTPDPNTPLVNPKLGYFYFRETVDKTTKPNWTTTYVVTDDTATPLLNAVDRNMTDTIVKFSDNLRGEVPKAIVDYAIKHPVTGNNLATGLKVSGLDTTQSAILAYKAATKALPPSGDFVGVHQASAAVSFNVQTVAKAKGTDPLYTYKFPILLNFPNNAIVGAMPSRRTVNCSTAHAVINTPTDTSKDFLIGEVIYTPYAYFPSDSPISYNAVSQAFPVYQGLQSTHYIHSFKLKKRMHPVYGWIGWNVWVEIRATPSNYAVFKGYVVAATFAAYHFTLNNLKQGTTPPSYANIEYDEFIEKDGVSIFDRVITMSELIAEVNKWDPTIKYPYNRSVPLMIIKAKIIEHVSNPVNRRLPNLADLRVYGLESNTQ